MRKRLGLAIRHLRIAIGKTQRIGNIVIQLTHSKLGIYIIVHTVVVGRARFSGDDNIA